MYLLLTAIDCSHDTGRSCQSRDAIVVSLEEHLPRIWKGTRISAMESYKRQGTAKVRGRRGSTQGRYLTYRRTPSQGDNSAYFDSTFLGYCYQFTLSLAYEKQ